jgi:hypothetical protein
MWFNDNVVPHKSICEGMPAAYVMQNNVLLLEIYKLNVLNI